MSKSVIPTSVALSLGDDETGEGGPTWRRLPIAQRRGRMAASSGPAFLVATDPEVSTRVVASGELDLATAPCLRKVLDIAIEDALRGPVGEPAQVTVDVSRVTLLCAAGLTVLVHAHRQLATFGAQLVVSGATGMTRRVLDITELSSVLCTREPTTQAADADSAPATRTVGRRLMTPSVVGKRSHRIARPGIPTRFNAPPTSSASADGRGPTDGTRIGWPARGNSTPEVAAEAVSASFRAMFARESAPTPPNPTCRDLFADVTRR